jgi:hypothetical protein
MISAVPFRPRGALLLVVLAFDNDHYTISD